MLDMLLNGTIESIPTPPFKQKRQQQQNDVQTKEFLFKAFPNADVIIHLTPS